MAAMRAIVNWNGAILAENIRGKNLMTPEPDGCKLADTN